MERRLLTAGKRKAQLDPFLSAQPVDVARRAAMLRDVHAAFSAAVLERRGAALRRCGALSEQDACSGEVWTGAEAARLGIVDGVGDLGPTLRRLYGQVPLPRLAAHIAALTVLRLRLRLRCAVGGDCARTWSSDATAHGAARWMCWRQARCCARRRWRWRSAWRSRNSCPEGTRSRDSATLPRHVAACDCVRGVIARARTVPTAQHAG